MILREKGDGAVAEFFRVPRRRVFLEQIEHLAEYFHCLDLSQIWITDPGCTLGCRHERICLLAALDEYKAASTACLNREVFVIFLRATPFAWLERRAAARGAHDAWGIAVACVTVV